jgi:hypothetical protein
MKITVMGPNLPRPLCDLGTMHAHAHGCRDLARYPHGADQGGWTIDAATIRDIVEDIYPPDQFAYDPASAEYETYRQDVHVAPCVQLPEEGTS